MCERGLKTLTCDIEQWFDPSTQTNTNKYQSCKAWLTDVYQVWWEFTGLLIVGQHHQRTCMHSRLESLDNAVHKRRGDIDSYHCTDNHATSISYVALTYRAVWLYEAGCSRHVTSFPGFPHLILCIHNVSIITTGGMEGQTGIWNTACTNQPSYIIQPTLENQFAYSGIQHSID